MSALINVIFPVFVIVALGFVLGKWRMLDVKSMSTISLYLFMPCLVVSGITKRRIESADLTQLMVFTISFSLAAVVLAWLIARALRLDQRWESALVVSTAFGNVGNFGLPMAFFAFGEDGLQRATIIFVASGILSFTVGIYFASRGQFSPSQAFAQIFRMPPIYATTVALTINAFQITLPEFISRPLQLLGDGSIPLQLVMVGVQLANTSLKGYTSLIGWAVAARLAGGIALGFVVAELFGLTGVSRQAAILQAAMPTAVNSSLFAVQFDLHPEFVTSVVVLTTLFSILTVTITLNLI